jgi:GDPmannose 4,6-dehydratase
MKTAIIIGVKGQDGQFLFNFLKRNDYSVIGFDMNYVSAFSIEWDKPISISSNSDVSRLIKLIQPDEIYYLAAYHHSSEDIITNESELIQKSYEINVLSYVNFLEAIRNYSKNTKIFYAASCHIFGDPINSYQDESTHCNPSSIYAITKYSGLKLSEYYRYNYSIFSSVGILYNHESHLRSEKFASKKIVKTAVEIFNKEKNILIIGNLNAEIDWSYAGDFVEAFVKILKFEKSENFIVASGKIQKLELFINYVFSALGLNWKKYVKESPSLLQRNNKGVYCGNYSKLFELTNWDPKTDLKTLAEIMVKKELSQVANSNK